MASRTAYSTWTPQKPTLFDGHYLHNRSTIGIVQHKEHSPKVLSIPPGTPCIKVKESHNRPSVAQRVPGGLGSQISWHSAHEGAEVVNLTHRPPLPPGNVPATHFHQGLSRPQGRGTVGRNMSLKNPVTPPGIDPGTVRLVTQHLNHYANPGPQTPLINLYKTVHHVQKKLHFFSDSDDC